MSKLTYVFAIVGILLSCKDSKPIDLSSIDIENQLDTLYLNEDMIGQFGFKIRFDSLTVNKHIPRNVWVDVSIEGEDTMVYVLKHANLFLTSKDSNFQIQRISSNNYKFYINNDYHGYIPNGGPVEGQECLEIYPVIQPYRGYALSTYWLDQPIIHPDKTNVMVLYETLEEVK